MMWGLKIGPCSPAAVSKQRPDQLISRWSSSSGLGLVFLCHTGKWTYLAACVFVWLTVFNQSVVLLHSFLLPRRLLYILPIARGIQKGKWCLFLLCCLHLVALYWSSWNVLLSKECVPSFHSGSEHLRLLAFETKTKLKNHPWQQEKHHAAKTKHQGVKLQQRASESLSKNVFETFGFSKNSKGR